jgi:hypothetical protein
MVKKLAVQAQATFKKISSLNLFFNPLQRTGIVLVAKKNVCSLSPRTAT